MNNKKPINRWQANFYPGLAIGLPAIIPLAIGKWRFGTVSNATDFLRCFLRFIVRLGSVAPEYRARAVAGLVLSPAAEAAAALAAVR